MVDDKTMIDVKDTHYKLSNKNNFANLKDLYKIVSNLPFEDPAEFIDLEVKDDFEYNIQKSKTCFTILEKMHIKNILKYKIDKQWNMVNEIGINIRNTPNIQECND